MYIHILNTFLHFHQITTRLNESIPRILPGLEESIQQLQDRQRQLQEIKPKIEVGGRPYFLLVVLLFCIFLQLSSQISSEVPQLQHELEEKNKSIIRIEDEVAKVPVNLFVYCIYTWLVLYLYTWQFCVCLLIGVSPTVAIQQLCIVYP